MPSGTNGIGVVGLAALAGAMVSAATSGARAQWSTTNLHPPGALRSEALGVGQGIQAGYATYEFGPPLFEQHQARLWSGTSASWIDLSPAGSYASIIRGVGGGQQVGEASFPGQTGVAGMWSGTAASWVPLGEGTLFATDGTNQVGNIPAVGGPHAAVWSGTAASRIDLHPAGTSMSGALGVQGGRQVGYVMIVSAGHASMWSGSAASWVDLNPAVASSSVANGIWGNQQVGSATVGGVPYASLWSGDAASWVNLNPSGSYESFAFAVFDGHQVGSSLIGSNGGVGGYFHASFWSGSAATWVDLDSFLPAGVYAGSWAEAIWSDGPTIYVAGYAWRISTGQEEAMLWTLAVPSPGAITTLGAGAFLAFRRRRR